MKMEMLSVQNHIQGQFGVIGTTKVKDWTSPLTAPAAAAAATGVAATALPANEVNVNVANVDIVDVDVVDGHPASVLHMRQHQSLNTRPRLSSSSSTSSAAAAAAAASSASVKPPSATMAPNFDIGYMPLPASTPAAACNDVSASAGLELSQQLQEKLREAKSEHLACTEVTLPNDLMQRIAAEIIRMSEREPCGERACTIFIEFESEPNNVRRIASFKVDPDTVSIFELYLTLKQDKSGWTSLLPQFIKNLTRSNTIVISPDFTLTKNKLYSSE